MKALKAALLAAGISAALPLLLNPAHSNETNNTPYQINTFDFLQEHIPTSKNYQKKWHRMTGFEHSGLHWEQFVVVYTDIGDSVYKHNFFQYSAWFDDPEDEDNEPSYQAYPVGTQFIKENYRMKNGKPGDAESITVMIKRNPGFNPTGGDWEYMQFNTQGEKLVQGSSKDEKVKRECASCHENISDRDYIFSNIFSGASQ